LGGGLIPQPGYPRGNLPGPARLRHLHLQHLLPAP
jgi:hypothetical protein